MNDLDHQLREYIETVAEPVSLDEVVKPRGRRTVWRNRPWIALAAGAGAVLIPTLVVVGIAQLTGSDPTVPPASSITTTAPNPPTSDPTVPPTSFPATTVAPPTTDPMELTIPGAGLQGSFVVATWERLVEHDVSGKPSVLFEHRDATALDGPAIASDRTGGLYVAEDGRIEYLAPGGPQPTELPIHPDASPRVSRSLAWTTVGGTDVLMHFGDTEADFYGFDPVTGEPWRDVVSSAIPDGLARFVGGRFAMLTDADGNEISREEESDVYLVVGNETAAARIKVSTAREREVRIHDFDGRRVVVSRHPGEPVGANATYLLVDAECRGIVDCVRVIVDQPGSAALPRTLAPEGPVVTEPVDLGTCSSAETSETLVSDDRTLPDAVQLTRRLILQLAADCNIADLHQWAAESPTNLVFGHAFVDGIAAAEMSGLRPLAEIVDLFRGDPARLEDGTYIWPAIADPTIVWEDLTDSEIDELAQTHDRSLLEESRLMGWYQGPWIEIAEDGRWLFYGIGLT